jgi:spermidine synthase
MPLPTRRVALLLFASGFCALIYQTTWLREFRLVFGASTAATAAVLGVFMSGLGFGGIVLGKRSESKARPLAFYARLELLIAISAGLSPLLILAARNLYIAVGGTQTMGLLFGTIVRLVLVALILGIPTFLMGGTLPAAARAVVTADDAQRRSIGILYGANTLGAVAGAVAGTFYSFEAFGNRITLWLAAAINVGVGLIALQISKSQSDSIPAEKLPHDLDDAESSAGTSPLFVLSAAGVVGFAFFLMEMVWYRMLGPILGGSTFSFGLILAVALFGIGMGGGAYAFFGPKRSASLHFFALTCAVETFFIAVPYALGDRIAIAAMLLRPLGTIGFYGHVIAWTALCMVVVFPAAFVSGIQFPVLVALLGKGRRWVGSQTGAAYASNTVGALIGSLAGGFGLIPLCSAPGVWKIVIILLASVAIVATYLAGSEGKRWMRAPIPLIIVALALIMLGATGPTAFWRHSQVGAGRIQHLEASPNEMRELVNSSRRAIIWEKDGIESSVALARADGLAFVLNGRIDGNAKGDAGTQVMCGLIGAALHPNPSKAMVIGLGTGSTAGWLAALPSMQRVDVAELEPAIMTVAQRCAPVNQNALLNPKLHVVIGDGREVMLTAREKYDLIVSEPSNPYRAGVANLFTREFYQSVAARLASGGIFLQWIQTYEIDDRTVQMLYRTLGSVFANIESWETETGDLLMMASREPVRYNAETLRARLAEQPFQNALLAAWHGQGLEDFLSHYVGNQVVAQALQNLFPGPLNTDDRTLIEFAFARNASRTNGFQMANLRAVTHSGGTDRPRRIEGDVDWSRVDDGRLVMYAALNRPEVIRTVLTSEQQSRAAAFFSFMKDDLRGALAFWRSQQKEPTTLSELGLVARCLASEGEGAALPYIDRLSEISPLEADAVRAEFFWESKNGVEATRSLEKFIRALQDDPWPPTDLVRRALSRAEAIAKADQSKMAATVFYDALSSPFSVFIDDEERLRARLSIGTFLDGQTPGEYTLRALEPFEPNIVWQRKFLQTRKDCYSALHHPRLWQATRDLDDFIKHETSMSDVSRLLDAIDSRSEEMEANPTPGRSSPVPSH